MSEQLLGDPTDLDLMMRLETAAGLAKDLPFEVSIWRAQNNYYLMLQRLLPEFSDRARAGDAQAQLWLNHFLGLGSNLSLSTRRYERAQAQKTAWIFPGNRNRVAGMTLMARTNVSMFKCRTN